MKTDDGGSGHSSSANSDQKTGFGGDAQNWTALSPYGAKPEPRYNHAATVVGRKMVVVGGETHHGLLDDVQVLHLGKLTWSELGPAANTAAGEREGLLKTRSIQQLPACKGHSLVSWGKTVLLVAGQMDPPSDRVSVWAFDSEIASWSRVEAKGDIPVARSSQSVTKAGSILIMFGGEDGKGRKLKDLHMFDLKSLMWLPLHTMGAGPSPRSKHVAALYDNRFLLIFGGASKSKVLSDLYSLDFETMEWSKLKTRGFNPSPRAGCVGVLCGDKWYIAGGEGRKMRCLETLMFDVARMTWSVVVVSSPNSLVSNRGFSLVLVQRKEGTFLVAFGGCNQELSNEVEVLIITLPEHVASRGTAITKKGSVKGEDSLPSTLERTPRVLSPALAGGTLPCSCISVAKRNLTSAADQHSSARKSLSEVSAIDQTTDVSGVIPLRKQFQQEEEVTGETTMQIIPGGIKINDLADQSVLESTCSQTNKYLEEVESMGQINAVSSVPLVDSQISSESDIPENLQKNEIGCSHIQNEKTSWQVTCQNRDSDSSVPCPSGRCGLHSLEMLPVNRNQLGQNSQTGDFESQFDGETINVTSPGKRMESLSDIQAKYEIMLAAALRKNAITQGQLSAALTNKEAAEKNLFAVMKSRQNDETSLSESLKEIELLKEKVLAAELAQEEANNLSNLVHAENVRLEHDLAFLKAILDDTQKELHTMRGVLAGERARAFQLQVEVFQLRQKLQSTDNRTPTPKKSFQV